MVHRMSGVAYGDIIQRHSLGRGTWTGMILSRVTGATGVFGDPVWSLIVIDDDENYWHPGEIKTISEREITHYRLTPDDAGA